MDVKFRVAGRVARPVHDVFEAVADPGRLSGYFTTGGARGRLETGATVWWNFADFPGEFPVQVVEVVADRRIVFEWDARSAAAPEGEEAPRGVTRVVMEFSALEDGRTLVSISEGRWQDNPDGLKAGFGNCEGWTGMLCALKVYVEHGINLREGFYK